jgi:hypothetical protein
MSDCQVHDEFVDFLVLKVSTIPGAEALGPGQMWEPPGEL